jgi:O-antigen/teichoic acid export membrane protein
VLKKLTHNKFIQSGLIFTTASFMVSVINYFFNLVVARGFDLSSYGEYMSALSYVAIFSVPMSAFSMVVIRKLGMVSLSERAGLAAVIQNWVLSKIKDLWPPIVALIIIIGAGLWLKGNLALLTIFFIFASMTISIINGFYTAIFQAMKTFFLAGIFMLFAATLKLLIGIGVITIHPTLVWLYFGLIISGITSLTVGYKMIFTKPKLKAKKLPKVTFKPILHYLKQKNILVPLLTSIGLIALLNLDVILVKKFFSSDEAGLYAALSLLGRIILYVAMPLSSVAFAYFTGSETKANTFKVLLLTVLGFVTVGLVSGTAYALFPGLIISIVFGEKFLVLTPLVYLSAIFGTSYALVNMFSQYFVAKNSYVGALTIFGALIQTSLIYLFNDQLSQVLYINIGVLLSLLVIYISKILLDFRYAKK